MIKGRGWTLVDVCRPRDNLGTHYPLILVALPWTTNNVFLLVHFVFDSLQVSSLLFSFVMNTSML